MLAAISMRPEAWHDEAEAASPPAQVYVPPREYLRDARDARVYQRSGPARDPAETVEAEILGPADQLVDRMAISSPARGFAQVRRSTSARHFARASSSSE